MPYIRKVRLGRVIHLAVSSCTLTRCCCGVRELQVFRSHPRGSRGVLCKILHLDFGECPFHALR
jgi:hypothetical protein